MNPAIEALVLSICNIALRISTAGQYHAHIAVAAHVSWVEVTVYPADHQYTGHGSADPLFHDYAYYSHEKPTAWDSEDPAKRCINALEKLEADLAAYLPEGMEAAA